MISFGLDVSTFISIDLTTDSTAVCVDFFLQVSLGGRGDFRNFVDEIVGYSNLWPKLAMRG